MPLSEIPSPTSVSRGASAVVIIYEVGTVRIVYTGIDVTFVDLRGAVAIGVTRCTGAIIKTMVAMVTRCTILTVTQSTLIYVH